MDTDSSFFEMLNLDGDLVEDSLGDDYTPEEPEVPQYLKPMLQRKHEYVREAMYHQDAEYFCVWGHEAAELVKQYGVDASWARCNPHNGQPDVEIRFNPYYDFSNRKNEVTVRIIGETAMKDTHFDVALDYIVDLAFFHWAKLLPICVLEDYFENKALKEACEARKAIDDTLRHYNL